MKRIEYKPDLKDQNGGTIVATAFVPYPNCPIAVARPITIDRKTGAHIESKDEFRLVHVAKGQHLGRATFKTRKAALEYIPRLKPDDPAWAAENEDQRKRCFELFKAAGPA